MNTASHDDDGLVMVESAHSVAATLDRLERLLASHGIRVFARLDFQRDAAAAGLDMPPEQQLIFGNPKAGTPLMLARRTAAIDLPLRAICWQDSGGKNWLAWNDPAYIVRRHALPEALAANLAAAVPLLREAAR